MDPGCKMRHERDQQFCILFINDRYLYDTYDIKAIICFPDGRSDGYNALDLQYAGVGLAICRHWTCNIQALDFNMQALDFNMQALDLQYMQALFREAVWSSGY